MTLLRSTRGTIVWSTRESRNIYSVTYFDKINPIKNGTLQQFDLCNVTNKYLPNATKWEFTTKNTRFFNYKSVTWP